uniref:Uncharacterized protein n=1 Tax=Solanum lycopersicum TaxID=4081 RepID=A0A3Q7FG72_SOLLC
MFTYNPRSHFVVAIYDQSTTEIEYPIDQDIESDEQEEDILDEKEDIPVNCPQTNANVFEQRYPVEIYPKNRHNPHEEYENLNSISTFT